MKYLILGATGTLGRATIKALLTKSDTEKILCLSRDELKQVELKRDFPNPKVQCVLGDIRDKSSIQDYFEGVDAVFHFAALKRIPEMEAHPIESLKTNVLGTINAAECAHQAKVKYFVFSSTDKACLPINTYGACKFLSEQLLFSYNQKSDTVFSVYRWANVLSSRGSVVYAFKDCIENGVPAHITDERMTRFWIKIEDAVKFVLETYQVRSSNLKIPELKAAPVVSLLRAIGHASGKPAPYVVVGMRPGEKLHEDMVYDCSTAQRYSSNTAEFYTDEELVSLAQGIIG